VSQVFGSSHLAFRGGILMKAGNSSFMPKNPATMDYAIILMAVTIIVFVTYELPAT
jgi:hypothetical protein